MSPPKLAVWKFASCDGCRLTLLDCEDELLTLAGQVTIANFAEASSATVDGPYDVSLVEGSVTTPHDEQRIRDIRKQSRVLVTIGACATAGECKHCATSPTSPNSPRWCTPDPTTSRPWRPPRPPPRTSRSTTRLHGCPIDRGQLLDTLAALLIGRKPRLPAKTVCTECKMRGVTCLVVADGTPCLGPVTHAGCGALCPKHHRGCFGCFGPSAAPQTATLIPLLRRDGMSDGDVERVFSTFNVTSFAAERQPR